MNSQAIKEQQAELNRFAARYLRGIHPLAVDGIKGPAMNSRILRTKYWLGYNKRGSQWDSAFVRKLRHPHSPRFSPPWQLALGANRRRAQRAHYARSQRPRDGLATYDGRQVAAWMVPQLDYARKRGWGGSVISGYRTPAYSRSLCVAMCGRPSCPGTCAGEASRHSQYRRPDGAVDLSDPSGFDAAIRGCPETPRLINRLPNDRPHHSSEGN